GLGDLPVLGPFFSNTSNERIEKELVILVTPYVVEPMEEEQIPPQPGSEVGEPTDWEFYFLNRIESREGVDFRSTTAWDNAQEHLYMMKMQNKLLKGQIGYSE
ncbi:MAG: pilus assembly protein CpaC, partial [Isosphaeraceae bacterium]